MSTEFILGFYAGGAVLSLLYVAGTLYANTAADCITRAAREEHWREDLGLALVLAFLFALMWPVGVPVAWCVSGFNKHGWRLSPGRSA